MLKYKNLILFSVVLVCVSLWSHNASAVTVSVSSNMSFCYTISGPPGSASVCNSGQSWAGLPDGKYCGSIDSGPSGYTASNGGGCSLGSGGQTLSWLVTWSPPACVPNGSCSASTPACGETTTGVDNCGNSCKLTGSPCPVTRTATLTMNGSGSVSDGTTTCTNPPLATCWKSYPNGTAVTWTASGVNGFTFSSWGGACAGSGNPCSTSSLTSDVSVTANFTAPPPPVRATLTMNGSGSVSDGTTTCTNPPLATCWKDYPSGTAVTWTASGVNGTTFSSWGGACAGSGNPCSTSSLTSDVSVTANFNAAPTATPVPRTVSITGGSASVPYGGSTNITWQATGVSSCSVTPSGWSGLSGDQSTGSLTMTTTYTVTCN